MARRPLCRAETVASLTKSPMPKGPPTSTPETTRCIDSHPLCRPSHPPTNHCWLCYSTRPAVPVAVAGPDIDTVRAHSHSRSSSRPRSLTGRQHAPQYITTATPPRNTKTHTKTHHTTRPLHPRRPRSFIVPACTSSTFVCPLAPLAVDTCPRTAR